jgi:hypothetical protein
MDSRPETNLPEQKNPENQNPTIKQNLKIPNNWKAEWKNKPQQ